MFRYTCTNYGMLHQIRVDCGKEFYLSLEMQEIYSNLRSRQDVSCYRKIQSKQIMLTIFFLAKLWFPVFLKNYILMGFFFLRA